MAKLLVCRKCEKPSRKSVEGRPCKGKALCRALAKRDDFPVEVVPCKCLGKCKKGPNAMLMPAKQRLHRVTVESLEQALLEVSA